jgi:RHS repeat-associated protein
MTYTYNLAGTLIEQKYPSGRVVKNVLDADGDLSVVKSKKNATSAFWDYAQNFTYTSAGAVSAMQLGNGRWESTVFNSRLQPTQIALGTLPNGTDKLKLNFDYGTSTNNGNVLSQTILVPAIGAEPSRTFTQTYTYDSLNRIKDAKEMIGTTQQWKQTFKYDRYGNREFDTTNNNTTVPSNCVQAVCNPTPDTTNNRLNGYLYDNAGNTTTDAEGRQFIYDAENKQTQFYVAGNNPSNNNPDARYFYDGDGKRVKKTAYEYGQLQTTIFVYDASGKLVAEYSTNPATQANAKVSYLTSDHLGSPRINTDKYGEAISRHDYRPFGDEIARTGYGTDDVRKQFTSYERDIETNLDYAQARYYKSAHGRFTSIDPIIMAKERLGMPQRLNLYIYTVNNPLKYTDPTGEDVAVNGSDADITSYENDLNKRLEKSKLKVKVVKGRLTIVGKTPKNLKGDALKLVKAIQNKDKTANISLVRNDGQVDFGSAYSLDKDGNLSTSNQRIDYAELGILNSAKIDGYDSSVVAMHETLEAIGIQIDGKSKEKAHDEAGDLGYPGLEPAVGNSQVTGVDSANGSISGFQNKVRIEGTQTTFSYETRFSKPFTPQPGQRGPRGEQETQKFRATSPLNITKVQK